MVVVEVTSSENSSSPAQAPNRVSASNNIVVACDRYEFSFVFSDIFLNGVRADMSHLPIDDGRELDHDDWIAALD